MSPAVSTACTPGSAAAIEVDPDGLPVRLCTAQNDRRASIAWAHHAVEQGFGFSTGTAQLDSLDSIAHRCW
jgi:hypothetical protein